MRMTRNLVSILPLAALLAAGCGQKPESIKLDPKMFEMSKKGESKQITAVAVNGKGDPIEGAPVEWSSSDAKIATVDGGNVTAVSSGTATITAKIGEINEQAFANVHIPTKIVADPTSVLLRGAGATHDVKLLVTDDKGKDIAGPALDWTSDNPAVVTVSGYTFTAVADGVAKVTVKSGAAAAVIDVVVKGPQATTVTIDPSPVVIKVNANEQLNTVVLDDLGQVITNPTLVWTSDDPSVAEVSPGGTVTGKRRGSDTIIKARAGNAEGSVPVKVR